MKKQFLILNGVLSVMVIVMLLGVVVNHEVYAKIASHAARIADGVPLPPPTQPPKLGSVEMADGVPLPPPTQPTPKLNTVLTADGVPLPPPTQPSPKLNIA